MSLFPLRCRGEELKVRKTKLLELPLFDEHTDLLVKPPYEVRSAVSAAAFKDFVKAVQGEKIAVTGANIAGLKLLCNEFGFKGLEKAFGEFLSSKPSFEVEESLRSDVCALVERVSSQELEIEELKRGFHALKTDFGLNLESRMSALECQQREGQRKVEARLRALADELRGKQDASEAVLSELRSSLESKVDCGAARSEMASLKAEVNPLKSRELASSRSTDRRGVLSPAPKPYGRVSREFKFTGVVFGGIIAALTRECGGNVDQRGVVAVTARDRDSDYYHERKAVDLDDKRSWYLSEGKQPDAWLCLDFKRKRVKPTHYSIRTYGYGESFSHLKSWVIEGWLDGSGWSELDRRENNEDLNGKSFQKTFPVSRSGEFQFLRLRMIDESHSDCNELVCSGFEVFGTLFE